MGLTDEEVIESIKKYGTNKLENHKKSSLFKLFIESLSDPIIKILLIVLAIKVVFLIKSFDWYETIGIIITIFLASFISSISEYGSEKAFIKMQEEASKMKCKVKRNNKVIEINIDDVVVGDIILLNGGDKVAADGYLIEGDLTADESTLDGESKEKYKKINDKLYRGTIIGSGCGKMKVEKVGMNTFYGKMALELQNKTPDSPLKIRLINLAKIISKIGYIGAFFVFFSYLFSIIVIDNNFDINLIKNMISNIPLLSSHVIYALTLAVTIIVVAVPEGLPMMITLVLSSNMKRMIKNNVLVRKLTGIETSGNLNLLFTDKTGTLTYGKLSVTSFESYTTSFASEFELSRYDKFYKLVKDSIIINNESITSEEGIIGGNSTDRALLSFFEDKTSDKKIIDRVLFNSTNKYSSVLLEDNTCLIKGAYEKILPKCNYYYDNNCNRKYIVDREKLLLKIKNASKRGVRVIVFASLKDKIYTLIGFAYLKDEVRKDAYDALEVVKNAGIKVIMITGDSYDTAYGVASNLGMISDGIIITSDELNKMTDAEVKNIIPKLSVVARSLPTDKSRLVKLSEEAGFVVGMTGDGINDAPALKNADVGFALGSGTEIAKEASDIVILDDNFMSIANAILYGRTIFKSIRKFIILQLTGNMCAMSLSIIGPFIGVNTPFTVIQMLWINMVMDTLAGLAFSYEPALISYMKEKPLKKDENIINKYMFNEITFTGIYSALLCILFLKLPFIFDLYRKSGNNKYFMTGFFALLIFIDVFNAFNARTSRVNVLADILKNKVFIVIISLIVIIQLIIIYYGGSVFRTSGLTINELLITITLSFSVVIVDMIRKVIFKKYLTSN